MSRSTSDFVVKKLWMTCMGPGFNATGSLLSRNQSFPFFPPANASAMRQ